MQQTDAGTPFVPELSYVGLLFALFVVPRLLQRYRIPAALTAFALGAVAGLGFNLFREDHTIHLLSTFGIVSLFLFAGLDVDLHQLRAEAKVLVQHVTLRFLLLVAVAFAALKLFALDLRAAVIVALGLVIPSTGFILDSLRGLGVSEREGFWIRAKAIGTELVALTLLFVTLQSTTARQLGLSTVALAVVIGVLPIAFRLFATVIVPHAPRSEFAFLMMVAVVCAFATRRLGVYYLVGAFLVGMAAKRFREQLPALASDKMLHAVEAFSSLFVPFYFFHAGLRLRASDFSLAALGTGALMVAVVLPLRLGTVALHRRLALGESLRTSLRVGVPMLPTLVFTLVTVEILRERFAVPPYVLGGLVIFTIVNTLVPALVLRRPAPDFELTVDVVPDPEVEPGLYQAPEPVVKAG